MRSNSLTEPESSEAKLLSHFATCELLTLVACRIEFVSFVLLAPMLLSWAA